VTRAYVGLGANLGDRERTLFASPAGVPATPNADSLEVLLRSTR